MIIILEINVIRDNICGIFFLRTATVDLLCTANEGASENPI
jgi:hypothetical protein